MVSEMNHSAPPPVFIQSCYRSGSTLLRFILDTHPEIYSPPELLPGHLASRMCTFLGGLEGCQFNFIHLDQNPPTILPQVRSFLAGHLESTTQAKGKRLWCEKSPNNLVHLGLLDALFPEARHLCLYRHCLDFANSATAMAEGIFELTSYLYRHNGHLVSALIDYWTEQARALLEFERSHREQCFSLKYEELVTDPPRVLAPLFSFLELEWDEKLLGEVFSTRHDEGVEDKNIRFTSKIVAHGVGSGRTVSLAGVSDELLAGMHEVLQELGYPAANEAVAEPQQQSPRGADLRWLFETHLQEQLRSRPEAVGLAGSSYRFDIEGEDGGSWLVDLEEGEAKVSAEGGEATCAIHVSADDLLAIARGTLNPVTALHERRLRLQGSAEFAALQTLTWLLMIPLTGGGLS
jgi:protein-tyrosine sulfotransferase